MGENAGGHVGHIVELHAAQVDAGFLLELVHHRVAQPLLVGEVAVDGAFVDACLSATARTVSPCQSRTDEPWRSRSRR